MFVAFFILVALVALFWTVLFLLPSQRGLRRFVYKVGMPPDRLNGGFPGDDVTAGFAGDDAWPSVTVIVPGRNEGHLLARTLGSLCAMEYPGLRVVFVDDQSTDNTADVCRQLEAQFPHLTVIHNKEGPRDGWIGKTWAVHQAEPHMHQSDYLLFTDSDLEFHPQCLKHAVRLAKHRHTDITSMLPGMRFETLGEVLGLLGGLVIINMKLSLYVTNNPRDPQALVAGGFLLVKREVYHALGGHAAVRGHVVEDIAFGTRAKALGKRVFTAATHDLYTARMYEGWWDTFRGLKKNSYAGANYNPFLAAFIVAFLIFGGAMTPAYVAAGIWLVVTMGTPLAWGLLATAVTGWGMETVAGVRTCRFVGMRAWWALILPAAMGFYLCIFVASVFDYYTGGNSWAGRRMKRADRLGSAGEVERAAD